jgi:NAD(P)-dependent dehydrogenase (short-subunit alcohol dehydrogenase family)
MNASKSQVVMITGAGGNLGSAVALKFNQQGTKLVLFDRKQSYLEKLAGKLQPGIEVLLSGVDMLNQAQVNQQVAFAVEQFGRLDVLVNTVGGYRAGKMVAELSMDDWDFMLNLNARTALIISQAVLPIMVRQESGKIIHVASRNALKGGAKSAAYGVSKAAVMRLTESISAEVKDKGINVNCIIPGTIDTPANRQEMPDADHSRWVKPDSLADVIEFLASEKARDIHGAAIPIYGRT